MREKENRQGTPLQQDISLGRSGAIGAIAGCALGLSALLTTMMGTRNCQQALFIGN